MRDSGPERFQSVRIKEEMTAGLAAARGLGSGIVSSRMKGERRRHLTSGVGI